MKVFGLSIAVVLMGAVIIDGAIAAPAVVPGAVAGHPQRAVVQKPVARAAIPNRPAPLVAPAKPVHLAGTGAAPSGLGGAALRTDRGSASIGGKSYQPAVASLNGTTVRAKQPKGH